MDDFFAPKRMGFACKYMELNPLKDKTIQKKMEDWNFKGTTLAYINRLNSKSKGFEKIYSIVEHNFKSLYNVFAWLGTQPVNLRMMRLGSDMLPFYTHDDWAWVYQEQEMQAIILKHLPVLGELARQNLIRLSLHPGQFCILNSEKPDVVRRAIWEFEYHTDVMRWMGFSGWHPYGMEINVHGGAKGPGLEPLIDVIKNRLSEDAKNWISIENDEYSYSVEDLHKLSDVCAILLDIHHHFINANGEFIQPDDKRIQPYIDSWRGVVPELHYSISPEYVLENTNNNDLPNFSVLRETYSRTDLRKHSDQTFNNATNDWVLSFSDKFDIMVEAKHKNLASSNLYNQFLINKNSLTRF